MFSSLFDEAKKTMFLGQRNKDCLQRLLGAPPFNRWLDGRRTYIKRATNIYYFTVQPTLDGGINYICVPIIILIILLHYNAQQDSREGLSGCFSWKELVSPQSER